MRAPSRPIVAPSCRLRLLGLVVGAAAFLPACGSSSGGADAAADRGVAEASSETAPSRDAAGQGADTGAVDAAGAGDVDAPTGVAEAGLDAGVDAEDASGPLSSGSPLRALAVATGGIHTCALLDNHRVKCWGDNGFGQLGYGDLRNRGAQASEMGDALPFVELGTGRTATALAAGRYQTCAILDDGTVKCWGWAPLTGLPLANGVDSIGGGPGQMGDALPALELGAGRKATHLACGYIYSCAALDDGTLQCWGSDRSSPVPLPVALGPIGPVRQLAPGRLGVQALFEDGSVTGDLPYRQVALLTAAQGGVYVAGSQANACAVLGSGRLSCTDPALNGPPPTATDFLAVGVGQATPFYCGLFKGGGVRCWGATTACDVATSGATYWCAGGRRSDGSFDVALGQPAVAIATGGAFHACMILADGGVKCFNTFEDCHAGTAGQAACTVAKDVDPNLAASVEIVTTGGGRRYGAWRAVNLGTHP